VRRLRPAHARRPEGHGRSCHALLHDLIDRTLLDEQTTEAGHARSAGRRVSRRPLTRQLSTLDASFLHIETPEAPLHSVRRRVRRPVSRAGLIARLAGRMDEIPRYRQRVVGRPLALDARRGGLTSFDLGEHIVETRSAAAGR